MIEQIKKELGMIVRDITAAGYAPKSQAHRQMSELIDKAYLAGLQRAIELAPERAILWDPNLFYLIHYTEGFNKALDTYLELLRKEIE